MDQETFNNLKPGDRIMLKGTGKTYTVDGAGTYEGDKAHRVRCEDGTATEAFYAPSWDLVPPPETEPGPVSYPHTVPVRVAARDTLEKLARTLGELLSEATLEMTKLRKERDTLAECVRRRVLLGPPDPSPTRDTLEKLVRTLGERLSEATRELTKRRQQRDTLGEMLIEQTRLTDEARAAAEEMRARLADAAEHTFSWEDEQEDDD